MTKTLRRAVTVERGICSKTVAELLNMELQDREKGLKPDDSSTSGPQWSISVDSTRPFRFEAAGPGGLRLALMNNLTDFSYYLIVVIGKDEVVLRYGMVFTGAFSNSALEVTDVIPIYSRPIHSYAPPPCSRYSLLRHHNLVKLCLQTVVDPQQSSYMTCEYLWRRIFRLPNSTRS